MKFETVDFSLVRILLIENNSMMRKLVREMLISFDVIAPNIVETDNVHQAIKSVYTTKFDLVITDFFLGALDGGDFTHHIRNDPDCPNRKVPILLITGSPNHDRVLKVLESGVNELLAKPIAPKTLYHRLISMLGKPRPFVVTSKYVGPSRGSQRRESMRRLMGAVQSSPKQRQWRKVETKSLRFNEPIRANAEVDKALLS